MQAKSLGAANYLPNQEYVPLGMCATCKSAVHCTDFASEGGMVQKKPEYVFISISRSVA
jgi:hypothetical protein